MDVIISTKNKHKIEEILYAIKDVRLNFIPLSEIENAPEIEEDGKSFKENAIKKACEIAKKTGKWALADDSGLEVEYLEGRPGIFSSRYAETNELRIQRILEEMKDAPEGHRDAKFVCCAALADPEGNVITKEASCSGYILHEPKGYGGFGYDPIFYVDILSKSMAELTINEKNHISHRGLALGKMKPILEQISRQKPKTINEVN